MTPSGPSEKMAAVAKKPPSSSSNDDNKKKKVNENAVRTAAGLIFCGAVSSVMLAFFGGEVWLVKWFSTVMVVDMLLRIFVAFEKSPTGFVASVCETRPPILANVVPKTFAWCIGLAMGVSTATLWWLEMGGPITLSLCLVCVLFSFLEFAFGFCAGCFIYGYFVRAGLAPSCKPVHCDATKDGAVDQCVVDLDGPGGDSKLSSEPPHDSTSLDAEPFEIQLGA